MDSVNMHAQAVIQASVQPAHLATANGNHVESLRSVDTGSKVITGKQCGRSFG